MKKILIVLMGLFTLVGLTACSNGNTQQTTSQTQEKKIDLTTLEGRKSAMTEMINEAYAIYEKKDTNKKIEFVKKYYSESFLANRDKDTYDMPFNLFSETFDNSKSTGYKFSYVDTSTMFYISLPSYPQSLLAYSFENQDNHIKITPIAKSGTTPQYYLKDSLLSGGGKEIIIK